MKLILLLIIISCIQLNCTKKNILTEPPQDNHNLSEKTITLPNGVSITKERFIVYLFIGHSNMAGAEKTDSIAHGRAWNFYIEEEIPRYENHTWIPAAGALHIWLPLRNQNGGGPGIPFLKLMVDDYPNYYFGVVQNAHTEGSYAQNYYKGGNLYHELIAAVDKIKNKVTIGGIVCMLGIQESIQTNVENAADFANNIKTMVQNFRDTLDLPDLPFFIGELEKGGTGYPTWTNGALVDSQIQLIPERIPYSAMVSSEGIPYKDFHHYTYDGQLIWAGRVVDIIQSKGWFPTAPADTKAPSAPKNLKVVFITSDQAIITWDHALDLESFITKYLIYINEDNALIGSTAAHITEYTINNLSQDAYYSLTVISEDADGNKSEPAFLAIATAESINTPFPPENITVILRTERGGPTDLNSFISGNSVY